jgi:sialidase-1
MQNLARWSADNGQTWSDPVDLTPVARDMNDKSWRTSVPGPGGAIQTRDHRLVVAMWKMPFACFTIFSDDHGSTWHRGQLVPGTQGGDECKVVELGDGRILFDMRQEIGPTRWLAESSDGGMTWTNLRSGIKVTPVACGLKRLANATAGDDRGWLLWTGPEGTKRKRLVIRTSSDEGRSFSHRRLISDDFAAYSDLSPLKDGAVGVLWERGVKKSYQFITFTRLDRAWLDSVLPSHPN